tara:strand:- start:7453 stop:8148 length:696 start_codon:yes stop_codon:yes gene_type:complete
MFFCVSVLLAINSVKAQSTLSTHARTEILDQNFGLSVLIPKEWSPPKYGLLIPPQYMFGYAWTMPTRQSENKNKIDVLITKAPFIGGHTLVCGMGDVAKSTTKELRAAKVQSIDFETGRQIADPKVEVANIFGIEPPSPKLFPSKESSLDMSILLGCGVTSAYVRKNSTSDEILVNAVTRIYTKHYIATVAAITHVGDYPKIAAEYNKVIKSIKLRCGKMGEKWCSWSKKN